MFRRGDPSWVLDGDPAGLGRMDELLVTPPRVAQHPAVTLQSPDNGTAVHGVWVCIVRMRGLVSRACSPLVSPAVRETAPESDRV